MEMVQPGYMERRIKFKEAAVPEGFIEKVEKEKVRQRNPLAKVRIGDLK